MPVASPPLGERGWVQPLRPIKQRYLPLPTMRGGMIKDLGSTVTALDPDLLVVSQLRAARYLDFAPRAALWLDQADVWSAFLRREVANRRGVARRTAAWQMRAVRDAEVTWSRRATALSAAGYSDRLYLQELAQRRVEWLPTAVAAHEVQRKPGGHPTAGFLANFAFWPNRDAFTVVRDHWAPALRRLGWRTIVAGLRSESLESRSTLEIIGPVEDLDDYYAQIDVALAPIRLGGGVKVKVIEALMRRRPVLASQYALEGFPPDLAAAIPTVEDIKPDFAPLARGEVDGERAFALAARYFSFEAWAGAIARIVSTVASPDGTE
jgi:polysaccharide biosynthesis protein PslH